MKTKLSNIAFNKNIVYFLFLPLMIIGKVIRYTLMKSALVDVEKYNKDLMMTGGQQE